MVLVAGSLALMVRHFDIRRIDDPAVIGYLFLVVFWIGGSAFSGMFPLQPQPDVVSASVMATGFIAYVLGAVTGSLRRRQSDKGGRYDVLSPVPSQALSPAWAEAAILVAGLALLFAYFLWAGGVPALAPGAENARVEALRGRGYLAIPGIALTMLGATALLAEAAAGQRRRALAVALVGFAAAVILGVGSRGPALTLVLGALWVSVFSRRLPRLRYLAATGAVVLLLMGLLGQARIGGPVGGDAILRRMAWTTYVNTTNMDVLTGLVPGKIPFLVGGGYLIDLSVLLPGAQPNLGTVLKQAAGLDFAGGGITIGLFGESYLNFGILGVVGICGAVGYGFSQVRARLPMRDSLDHALSILLPLTLMGVMNSGLTSPLLYQTVPLLCAYAAARLISPGSRLSLWGRLSRSGPHRT
jgi:oligosaccharide repeat unit polymerase